MKPFLKSFDIEDVELSNFHQRQKKWHAECILGAVFVFALHVVIKQIYIYHLLTEAEMLTIFIHSFITFIRTNNHWIHHKYMYSMATRFFFTKCPILAFARKTMNVKFPFFLRKYTYTYAFTLKNNYGHIQLTT